jgi:hypothetical protein
MVQDDAAGSTPIYSRLGVAMDPEDLTCKVLPSGPLSSRKRGSKFCSSAGSEAGGLALLGAAAAKRQETRLRLSVLVGR